jgi:type I restriction enzyme S subunit
MSEWKEYKLSDLMEIKYGKDHKHLADGSYPLYGSGGIMRYVEKSIYEEESILIPRKGTLSNLFYVNEPFWSVDTLFWSKIKQDLVLPKYLYYTLKTYNLAELNVGSAVPSLTTEVLNKVLISIPVKNTQTAITEILSSLDDKIELNNKINQELETLAQTLFKQWLIDFEFPNENGEPYKSSGGEMVDSELGEIPKGWKVNKLNDIVDCFDNKRVPLSSMERNVRKGIYPYYGAASLMDYIDDYLFEGVYILMGEDGSVTDNIGYPVLQYVFGKFWVNNHAHVLKGRKISTELVLCLLKNTNISDLVTGAVQPKLNQGNMNKISIPLPNNLSIISDLEKLITEYYNLFRNNILEIKELISIRDNLLPKLISGELEINEYKN